jgi:hypothetical protein
MHVIQSYLWDITLATKTTSFEGDCEADFPTPLKTGNSEEKKMRLQREDCVHPFDSGFIPESNGDRSAPILGRIFDRAEAGALKPLARRRSQVFELESALGASDANDLRDGMG